MKKFVCLLLMIAVAVGFGGCRYQSQANTKDVVYLISEKFEGAVLIYHGREDGIAPIFDKSEIVFEVPESGIIKTNFDAKELRGKPKFFFVNEGGERTELEYLYPGGPKYPENQRTEAKLTAEERSNKVFAMSYEYGSLNSPNGGVLYISFLVCKPKDGNLFASRDLSRKIMGLN
jgi:hypothetical protein